jgi:hypothetical protein
MVVQKNIYDTMWASQTLKSQLSRDISLSLEHRTYNLDVDNPYTLQISITPMHGSCLLLGTSKVKTGCEELAINKKKSHKLLQCPR